MKPRADYTVTLHDDVIAIVDLNLGNVSVTNDAEWVIRDLVAMGHKVDRMRVIYRDSAGQWDRMATKGRRFRKFLALRPRDLDEAGAISAVRRMSR
jgi:hypothetical protein